MRNAFRRVLAAGAAAVMVLSCAAAALADTGRVQVKSLNMRKSPSTSSQRVHSLDMGDKVDILSTSGSWYKVRYGKYTGYVMKKYLKVTVDKKDDAKENKTSVTLRKGSSGSAVKDLQRRLKELGYYSGSIDGKYDSAVVTAVKNFQKRNGLTADGVAGARTLSKLKSSSAVAAKRTQDADEKEEKAYKTETYKWFSNTNKIPKGASFTVKDCKTGKTFRVKRWSGANHLDAEPLTAKDSATMKSVYGGEWSWRRRPILVLYNGHVYAASMNGMPHGEDTISGNSFDGHFCIHFSGSRTHGSNKVDSDHQNAIKTALKYTW